MSGTEGSGPAAGAAPATVAFLGLGAMGAPMARRLGAAGHRVTGHDPAPGAAARLRGAAGVRTAESAGAAVARADAVILMVPDSAAVESILLAGGLLDRLPAGTLLLDMGSSEPLRTRELAERARARGVRLVDAPVSGGVAGAEAGTLTVMAGGAAEDFAAALPLLRVLGERVRHVGPAGAGHAVKALNNLMSATHLLVSSEALLAGARFGVDPAVMLEAVNGSSGRSASTEQKWPRFVLDRGFDSGFALRLMVKDMRTATALAEATGGPAPLGEAALALWESAAEELPPGADHTEIVRWLEGRAAPPEAEGRDTAPPAGERRDTAPLTPHQLRVRAEFQEARGTWGPAWESVLRLDPDFLAAYTRFSAVPWRTAHLPPKVKEFVYIAVDAAATHLYEPGIRQHVRAALAHGATAEELAEVLALTSTLGIHAVNIGVPLLLDVLAEEGLREGPAPLDEERRALRADFERRRGYWHTFWDGLLELDPELFAAYLELSSLPWDSGVLEPRVKELIYVAFDASATHLYAPGLRLHLRNAVRYGATTGEIMEVLEIASVVGVHTATTAAPIVLDELRAAGA